MGLGDPGNRLGLVSYRIWSPRHGLAQALRQKWTSPHHPHLCDLRAAVVVCLGCILWGLVPAIWVPWGAWGPVGSLSEDSWAGSGDLAWGCCQLRCASSSARTWTTEGDSCALRPFPFLSEQRTTFVWQRFTGTSVSYLRNKGCVTKKFATTNHAPPSPFQEKGFVKSFWGVGWF